MANPQHIAIINKGVDAWNRWRQDYPEIRPDLSYSRFQRFPLQRINLSGAILRFTDFNFADLYRADFISADLRHATFCHSKLRKSRFIDALLCDTKLIGADLTEADFTISRGSPVDWPNGISIYQRPNLSEEDAKRIISDMDKAAQSDSSFTANFSEANLSGSNFSDSYFMQSVFVKSVMAGVDFTDTNLIRCDLRECDLSHAHFLRTDLTGANLSSARMAITTMHDIDLSEVNGLESIYHSAPSSIGIDTLYRSHFDLPRSFLQGVGVPEDSIDFIMSAKSNPIEFHSCFISYSSKDQDFVERLHSDLQSNGVRCWFASSDMKIGDKIRQVIEDQIRLFDKVLLVLSENSISSTWVEKEVETTFEEERKRGRTLLFPIRLDSCVMESGMSWAADIRRMRNIGDFSKWKDPSEYQKAFEKLLNDLKESPPTHSYA